MPTDNQDRRGSAKEIESLRNQLDEGNPQNPDGTDILKSRVSINFREAQSVPVIIYGPPGSGKTRYSSQLAAYYRRPNIIDDWEPGIPVTPYSLVLTQRKVEGAIPIEQALLIAGIIDLVNHPPHYKSHPSGIECITIIEHFNLCLGNVIKYIWRAGEKQGIDPIQDLEKARWYLDREIERRKKK